MTKEQQEIIKSFSILVDSREQDTDRARERYASFGVEYARAVLDYGDYTYNLALPGGQLHDLSKRIQSKCVIERKQDLDELAMCFTRSRERFEREFERAKAQGARIYLLVENASIDALLAGQYRSKFAPKAFIASLMAYSVRYGMAPVFCNARNSGAIIREILYRDAKERLEGGEF